MEIVKEAGKITLTKVVKEGYTIDVFMSLCGPERSDMLYIVDSVMVSVSYLPNTPDMMAEFCEVNIEGNRLICGNENDDSFIYIDEEMDLIPKIKLLNNPFMAMKEEWGAKDNDI